MFKYHKQVAYHETDCMGVVHHSNYLKYFEEARVAWIQSLGAKDVHFPDIDYTLAVTNASLKYIKPLRVCEDFSVSVKAHSHGIKIEFEYEVSRANEVVTTGTTEHVGLDANFSVKKPPRRLLELLRD